MNEERFVREFVGQRAWPLESPFVTYKRLEDIVRRITYKPNWTLRLRWDSSHAYYVTFYLLMEVPDLRTGKPLPLSFCETAAIDFFAEAHEDWIIRMWIYPFILRAEEHEMREWFKLDGKHVVDPHPELPKDVNGLSRR